MRRGLLLLVALAPWPALALDPLPDAGAAETSIPAAAQAAMCDECRFAMRRIGNPSSLAAADALAEPTAPAARCEAPRRRAAGEEELLRLNWPEVRRQMEALQRYLDGLRRNDLENGAYAAGDWEILSLRVIAEEGGAPLGLCELNLEAGQSAADALALRRATFNGHPPGMGYVGGKIE